MRSECINLTLSTYTEWYWQMDLKNMFHFLKLRMDSHAQWEIQKYGRSMAKVVKADVSPSSRASKATVTRRLPLPSGGSS